MNQMLGKISGVDIWMILSLIMFGLFFLAVIVRLFLIKKTHVEYLSQIPFSKEEIIK
jgi:hypothetical protein